MELKIDVENKTRRQLLCRHYVRTRVMSTIYGQPESSITKKKKKRNLQLSRTDTKPEGANPRMSSGCLAHSFPLTCPQKVMTQQAKHDDATSFCIWFVSFSILILKLHNNRYTFSCRFCVIFDTDSAKVHNDTEPFLSGKRYDLGDFVLTCLLLVRRGQGFWSVAV